MKDSALPPVEARFSVDVIENLDAELLFLRRSATTRFGPELWGFAAGHIESGESPKECALRELREEIGDNFALEPIKDFGPVRDSFYGGVYEIYLFHFLWLGGEIRLNHEHTDYAWVDRHAYKRYRVMDGIDEDIRYLDIWPIEFLNQDKLPSLSP